MDVDGFIPLSLIANFYRVQALSQDQDLILQVQYEYDHYIYNDTAMIHVCLYFGGL